MKSMQYGLSMILILISPWVFSENKSQHSHKISRYTVTSTEPTNDQRDLLSVVLTIQFPRSVETIGDAVKLVLEKSSYRLDESESADNAQYYLYRLALPESQRVFTSVSLKSILTVLGNESYTLNINPVRRTISYQIKDDYKKFINDDEIASAKSQWFSNTSIEPPKKEYKVSPKQVDSKVHYYGPIVKGESLSSIAHTLSHYGASAEKIMVAVFLKNSGSFLESNINLLIEGTTLRLPRKNFVHSISSAQAKQFVELHHQRWVYRNKRTQEEVEF